MTNSVLLPVGTCFCCSAIIVCCARRLSICSCCLRLSSSNCSTRAGSPAGCLLATSGCPPVSEMTSTETAASSSRSLALSSPPSSALLLSMVVMVVLAPSVAGSLGSNVWVCASLSLRSCESASSTISGKNRTSADAHHKNSRDSDRRLPDRPNSPFRALAHVDCGIPCRAARGFVFGEFVGDRDDDRRDRRDIVYNCEIASHGAPDL